jgi:hypothetical protein
LVGASLASEPPKLQATDRSALCYTNVEGFLRLEGSNAVHDWLAVGREINCSLKVRPGFPAQPGQSVALEEAKVWCEASIPVKSLKSIGKDGSPYSSKCDEVMYERLDEAEHPAIRFRLERLVRAGVQEGKCVFDASGQLAVRGVTNTIRMPLRITAMSGARLKVAGVATLKQGDFKILPGVVCFVAPRDDVRVVFNLTLEKEGTNGPD